MINDSTRVTRKKPQWQLITFSLIALLKVFKTAIIKSDISDHFPICFLVPSSSTQRENKTTFIYKRISHTKSIESFKKKLYQTDWEETETSKTPDEAYTTFLQKFIAMYDNYFFKKKD